MNRLCKSLKVFQFAVAAGLAAGLSMAASADPAKPDIARGQAIASQVCAACHGADGNSAGGAYPKLAGQHAEYLVKQLRDFKPQGGKPPLRNNLIMAGFAAVLSDQDMINVTAWFSSQTPKPGFAHDVKTVALGQTIWRGGIADKGVPACAACHGPTGQGIPIQYPRLSGQWSEYVVAQLNAFQQGTRNNSDPMRQIAHRMSDDEIKAVADYAAGLH
ncbi:c-type cytochrome [Paraburkholderia dinghuensis]|uniref:Cytochrome c4 n=1 Tax=Paraburkholderia dinghuensis TaxID=2305225 RepID=A0A3N6PTD5_9BURK|nr:c-type cytochrome [Paraburkholderia dinghuensis]RQH02906.1 cytochrome c4 [Paraburkholderia dinghuensis]